jgi:hypothetical protein
MTALCFLGGCFLPVLTCSPFLVRRSEMVAAAIGPLAAAGAAGWVFRGKDLPVVLQAMTFAGGGALVFFMLWQEWRRSRGPETVVALLWIVGTLWFAAALNWTINGRSFLPMAPAVSILLVRRLQAHGVDFSRVATWAPLGLSLIASLLLAHADWLHASAARTAAQRILAYSRAREEKPWFQGHWGFQYYMEQGGGCALDINRSRLRPGNLLALPAANSNPYDVSPKEFVLVDQIDIPLCSFAAVNDAACGAGFYSYMGGPLPFSFGARSSDYYGLAERVSPWSQPRTSPGTQDR